MCYGQNKLGSPPAFDFLFFTWLLRSVRCCFDHIVVAEEMQGDLACTFFGSISQLPIPSASYVIGFLVKVKVSDTHMLF